MKVKVRTKLISHGRRSLYLEIYRGQGRRTKEYLELYIFDAPTTASERTHNRTTLALAEKVRTKRQSEVDDGRFGFLSVKSEMTVGEYLRELVDERTGTTAKQWVNMLHYADACGITGDIMATLTADRCDRFRRYLMRQVKDGTLRPVSAQGYFACFRTALRQAYRHQVIREPLHDRIDSIQGSPRPREFLTLDEARRLMATEYREPHRSIILFALLTGLRTSDIKALEWSQVIEDADGHIYIQYRQPKVQRWSKKRIPAQAVALLGQRGTGKVFRWVPWCGGLNAALAEYLTEAGITRRVTMHCLRHSYAILQLAAGTPVEVVSKLLGHSDVRTTQIYARVLDSAVDDAADRIIL